MHGCCAADQESGNDKRGMYFVSFSFLSAFWHRSKSWIQRGPGYQTGGNSGADVLFKEKKNFQITIKGQLI